MIIFMIMRWRMVKCARYLYLNIITTMVIIIFGEDSYDENENVKKMTIMVTLITTMKEKKNEMWFNTVAPASTR